MQNFRIVKPNDGSCGKLIECDKEQDANYHSGSVIHFREICQREKCDALGQAETDKEGSSAENTEEYQTDYDGANIYDGNELGHQVIWYT